MVKERRALSDKSAQSTPLASRTSAKNASINSRWAWAVLVVALAFAAGVRWRMLEVPLDRDEGEFAYMAQQMLAGVPPYESGYAMKLPGIYAAYALSMLCFGQSIRGIHLGFAVVNAVSTLFVFVIARRLYGPWIGAVASSFFALISLDVRLQGSTAQAEHFVLLPMLVGLWILLIVFDRSASHQPTPVRPSLPGLALAGLCFGTAVIIKQHAFSFCLFAAWYVADQWWKSQDRSWSGLIVQLSVLTIGGLTPLAVTAAAMSVAGVYDQFQFWTFTYARQYAMGSSLGEGWQFLLTSLTFLFWSLPLVWITAGLGVIALVWDPAAQLHRRFMLCWLGLALLGTCPGLHFFLHAFVFVLPAVAILAALGCHGLIRAVRSAFRLGASESPVALVVSGLVVLALTALPKLEYLFWASPQRVSQLTYFSSPFPAAIEIARYISSHSNSDGPIMVLGSEPQIYFYTKRRAASPHLYMYPLMEQHDFALTMQQELAADVDSVRPEWIVYESFPSAWARRPESKLWMMSWQDTLLSRDYNLVAVVEIRGNKTIYSWDVDFTGGQPLSSNWLSIHRRKSTSVDSSIGQPKNSEELPSTQMTPNRPK